MCFTDLLMINIVYAVILGVSLGFIGRKIWKIKHKKKDNLCNNNDCEYFGMWHPNENCTLKN